MIFLPGRNTDRFVDMRPEQGYSRFRLAGEQIVKFRLHGFTHGRSIRRNAERDIHLHGPRGKNMDVRRYRPAFVDMGRTISSSGSGLSACPSQTKDSPTVPSPR